MEIKKDDYSDIIDEDNYTWGNQGKIDIKKIITSHIDRISRFIFQGSQPEFREGKGVAVKTNDRRETTIDAIEFLVGLVEPYYDPEIKEKQKDLFKNVEKEEKNFFDISAYNEAYRRASADKINPSKAFKYWLDMLKGKTGFFDKDSTEYEYFIYMKYKIMMTLFKDINYLLKRKGYLEDEDYEE